VESGHGLHAYWLLKKPHLNKPLIEAYLKGLAVVLSADLAAAEVARVLRVPGTLNYKEEEALPVKCIRITDRRYRLKDFARWRLATKRKEATRVYFEAQNPRIDLSTFELSGRILKLISTGWTGAPYRSRSEADMAVITAAVAAGMKPAQIREIFRNYPIGEKYREKGNRGDAYLRVSIKNAVAFRMSDQQVVP
jgi:putative DNA primase/helicase